MHRYRVVDVFTTQPLEGNALAVFPNASGLDTATMQRIAREFNLSETAFVLPSTRPDCVAQVRIFTPSQELSFAGHPTIGTAWVLLDEGIVPTDKQRTFSLDEPIGPVAIHVDAGTQPMIWLSSPPVHFGRTFEAAACANVLGLTPEDLLGIPPQALSTGNPMLFIALRDKDAVDRASLDPSSFKRLPGRESGPMGVFVFAPTAEGAYSRMFGPELGITEDPATGSATGPLAAYMMRYGLVPNADGTRFISEQGTKMGRRSFLYVHIRGANGTEGIYVGGHVAPVANGTMLIG